MALFNFELKFSDKQFDKIYNLLDRNVDRFYKLFSVSVYQNKVGFDKVTEAITNIKSPVSLPETVTQGKLTMRFKFDEDNDQVDFTVRVGDLKTAHGHAVGAGDIDITAESTVPESVASEISDQQLSEDGMSVSARASLQAGDMSQSGIAVVTVKATNRDTGVLVAFGSAELVYGPGEAAIGNISMDIPLEEVEEPTPTPEPAPESIPEPAPVPEDGGIVGDGEPVAEG